MLGFKPKKIEMREEEDFGIGQERDEMKIRPVVPYEGKKWFEVQEGVYDFTRLPGSFVKYDEDVVRYNINKVARPISITI